MQVETLQALDSTARLVADVCLVGSGPAALSIARELTDKKIRVLIVESGSLTEDEASTSGKYEVVGQRRIEEPALVRNRIFGGTSHTWSGRCAMFDRIDFEERSWVPLSGWPVNYDELLPFKQRANAYVGIEEYVEEAKLKTVGSRTEEFPGQESLLSTFFWTFSRDPSDRFDHMRFGPEFLKREQSNIRVLLQATVTHVNTTEDGESVVGLEVRDKGGRCFEILTQLVVLCGGGIENPRILLASNRVLPRGLGNQHDLVGRFLMDHPRPIVADLDPVAAEALRDSYSFFRLNSGAVVATGFALPPETQRRERLLNCAAWLDEDRSADDPWDALKRLRRPSSSGRKMSDARAVIGNPGLLMRGIRRRLLEKRGVPHKLNGLYLRAIVEQVPDPSSRVLLSDQVDEHGVPLPRIDWRIGALERRSIARLAELIEQELPKLGFEKPTLRANPEFIDAAHPSGATRMAEDPTRGVVDKHCAVYGTRGLYVAGSSVFPTASHVNPTLMIVIMAVRLAEELRRELSRLATPQYIKTK
jgi:choline dehydrogenase-like flavoprotein